MQKTAEKTRVFVPIIEPKERLRGKEAIREILSRAAEDGPFLAKLAENPAEALSGYYSLNQEEMAALVSGDMKRIEGWLGKLDKKQATWLWARLGQEKW